MAVKLQFLSGRNGQVKTVHGEEEGRGQWPQSEPEALRQALS